MTNTPSAPQPDRLDAIIQEMLLQYTAWVNGEPIAWNVKKAEAKAALEAEIAERVRAAYSTVNTVLTNAVVSKDFTKEVDAYIKKVRANLPALASTDEGGGK